MTRDQLVQQAFTQLTLPAQVSIRAWQATDHSAIRDLAFAEGWTTLSDRPDDGMKAWQHSWPALVVTHNQHLIGFLRALTDEAITLYVADLLVAPDWRGQHLGSSLLEMCHRLYPTVRFDLLSTARADIFYQVQAFRSFPGFRKSYL